MYLIAYMEYRKWHKDESKKNGWGHPAANYELFLRVNLKSPDRLQPGFWSDES